MNQVESDLAHARSDLREGFYEAEPASGGPTIR
jgi:hypothetical protein